MVCTVLKSSAQIISLEIDIGTYQKEKGEFEDSIGSLGR